MVVSWNVLQVISESLISGVSVHSSLIDVGIFCNIRLVFLIRVLLNSRSGLEKSDSLVHHVTRRVIQVGLFATTWSIAGVATWFLLPRHTVYTFFDMTAGSIYTHVSSPFSPSRNFRSHPYLRMDLLR